MHCIELMRVMIYLNFCIPNKNVMCYFENKYIY